MITPELAQVISAAIDSALLDVHVALPGTVQSYDAATQTAEIELGVDRLLPDGRGGTVPESLPLLVNVPVSQIRGGDFFIHVPVAAGTSGLVVFCEASIDTWRSRGAAGKPDDVGRHTLSAGVFFPGVAPNNKALSGLSSSDLVVGKEGGSTITIKTGGDIVAETAGGEWTLSNAGQLDVNGNLTVDP